MSKPEKRVDQLVHPPHSPEPWVHEKWDYQDCVVTGPIVDANNMCVVGSGPSATVEDFDRIVACVNACRGLNPEVVPELVEMIEGLLPFAVLAQGRPDTEAHANLAVKMTKELLAKVKA